jgi:hypothetical protein
LSPFATQRELFGGPNDPRRAVRLGHPWRRLSRLPAQMLAALE